MSGARTDAERAVLLSEEKFAKVFRSSPDWIAISALSDGRFIEVNDAFLTITGYRREEVIGRRSSDLGLWVNPDERARVVRLLCENGVIRDHEVSFRMKSGEIRTMLRSAELIELEGEKCIINVTRDITDRKRAEEEIRKLNAELESRISQLTEANKELDAFSSSVSHDLRAPLMVIGGFSRVLSREYGEMLDDKGMEMLDTIRKQVGKMENLIDDLLTFSRSGRREMKRVRVDMDELAESVFKELTVIVPHRKIEFRTTVVPSAYADPSLIRQVLVNLFSNAIKFTATRDVAVIEFRGSERSTDLLYSVRDNGVGFDMERAKNLFNVFQRLHSSEMFEGTGLGLSIVQRIVNRHGGRTWAEAAAGTGATFYFTLPRRE